MSKALAAILRCGYFFAVTFAIATDQPYRGTAKQATATCRAEVKGRASTTKCRYGRNTRLSKNASKRLSLSTKT